MTSPLPSRPSMLDLAQHEVDHTRAAWRRASDAARAAIAAHEANPTPERLEALSEAIDRDVRMMDEHSSALADFIAVQEDELADIGARVRNVLSYLTGSSADRTERHDPIAPAPDQDTAPSEARDVLGVEVEQLAPDTHDGHAVDVAHADTGTMALGPTEGEEGREGPTDVGNDLGHGVLRGLGQGSRGDANSATRPNSSHAPVAVDAARTSAASGADKKGLKWREGAIWISDPPGVLIIATAESVTLESGGRFIAGMRMHRPEALVLLDEAHIAVATPRGMQESKTTPTHARAWAEGGTLDLPTGTVSCGPQLVAAWDEHVARHRAARSSR